jgi:hypothetical protein
VWLAIVGCGGCAAERRTVTVDHYLQPCDTTPAREGWMNDWCFRDRVDGRWRGDTSVEGFEPEWGLEQRIRVRVERRGHSPHDYTVWILEEVLERVPRPGGTVFEWSWDGGLLAFGSLEQVDGTWRMRPRYRPLDAAKGLEPGNADVEVQLEMLAANERLKVNRMALQYGDDPAVDPLIVLEVEIGDEIDPEDVPAWPWIDPFADP